MKQFCFQWLMMMLRPTLPNDSLEHQGHKPAKEPGGKEAQAAQTRPKQTARCSGRQGRHTARPGTVEGSQGAEFQK